jgi:hypothetical protein
MLRLEQLHRFVGLRSFVGFFSAAGLSLPFTTLLLFLHMLVRFLPQSIGLPYPISCLCSKFNISLQSLLAPPDDSAIRPSQDFDVPMLWLWLAKVLVHGTFAILFARGHELDQQEWADEGRRDH